MKITFKRQPRETGLYLVGHPYQDVDIKVDKKVCGYINSPSWNKNSWDVWITVIKKDIMEDGNPNCKWGNVPFKKKFSTEEEARAAVPNLIASVLKKGYQLYFSVDEKE